MENQKVDLGLLEEGEEGEDLLRVIIAGTQFDGKRAVDRRAQGEDDLGEKVWAAEESATGEAGRMPAKGAAEVEVEVASAGGLSRLSRQDQDLGAVAASRSTPARV
jgi:hypothetical protein